MFQIMSNNFPKRHYHFIIDCSNSMSGGAIRNTKIALLNAVNNLPLGHCKLSMTKFGTRVVPWDGNRDNDLFNLQMKSSAIQWIDQLEANLGRTEMHFCLQYVLQQTLDNDYKRQVFLITDAAIYDSRELTKLVKEHYENTPKADGSLSHVPDPHNRFFVLGVGNGVSKSLCEDLANAGGGVAAFAQADTMVAEKAARLLAYAVRKPPLTVKNVSFDVQLFDGNQMIHPIDLVDNSGFSNNLIVKSRYC